MTTTTTNTKPVSTNPLKMSAPLGAAMAFLGVEGSVPLFHGSQGCTAFALVLMVRHFKETIPIQTTAMNEVSTILGGADHVEEALLNLKSRMNPKLIGICSTALTETRGEDFAGDLKNIMERRAATMHGTKVVFASTPDFTGSLEEGWSKATASLIEALVPTPAEGIRQLRQINILAGQHLTPGDIDALRDTVESFGLEAIILPDISNSLDGTVPDTWVPTSMGGTKIEDIAKMGRSLATFAIGEHMRAPGELLAERTDVPLIVLDSLTGLEAMDRFVVHLSTLAGKSVPERLRRERSRLIDAMLDGHFYFAGKKVVAAAEPDLLYAITALMAELGGVITSAITTSGTSKVLSRIPTQMLKIGDLGDMELDARGADLIATHSHGRQAAHRLHLPHLRVGFPIFDRLGAAHQVSIGYAGTRQLIFKIANLFLAHNHKPTPQALDPFARRDVASKS